MNGTDKISPVSPIPVFLDLQFYFVREESTSCMSRQVSDYFTLLMTETSSEAYLSLERSFSVPRRSICETYSFILALRHYVACLKQKNEINSCSPYTKSYWIVCQSLQLQETVSFAGNRLMERCLKIGINPLKKPEDQCI